LTAPLLEFRSVDLGYHGRAVLRDVTLRLEAGESVAVLGPNGAGKSTLLRGVLGLTPPMAGEIWLSGDRVDRLPPRTIARRVAAVPQEESFAFPFRVWQVVVMGRLPFAPRGADRPEDLAAAHAAMERADCRHLAERFVTDLSGGEKQRVLLARALAQEAPLLVLDEPTSHLDIRHQMEGARLARSYAAEGGSVLAAVHDLNLAQAMADRVWLFDAGRLVFNLPTEQAIDSPHLEDVYGVRFHRTVTTDGRRWLLPAALN
jgi:iron complex transport system ATP-binding protein